MGSPAWRPDNPKSKIQNQKYVDPRLRDRLSRRYSARRLRDELRKRVRVRNGQFRKDLAVNLDTRFTQSLDETVVGRAVLAAGRADTCDPKSAEVTLLVAAVAV